MLDIEPIKARLAAATPGPWSPRHAGHGSHVTTGRYDVAWCGTTFGVDRNGTYGREGAGCVADAELIANAPTDLAALIAEVERLRNIIGEAREELRIPHDPDCQACGGTGHFHDDVTRWSHRCDCHEPYPIAVARHERELRAEADRRAMFERDHGHGYDEGCRQGCPVEF